MSEAWKHNGKVEFSIYSSENKEYLICHSSVGNVRIRFIEDVLTGKRIIPNREQKQQFNDSEDLIRHLIEQV